MRRTRLMAIWEPKPAARRMAYCTGYQPPRLRFSMPSSGSTSLKLGTGGTTPCSSALTATTSSIPTLMGWPVKPLVLQITIWLTASPKTCRSAATSAEALPPRAGVKVSCETNTVCWAIRRRVIP